MKRLLRKIALVLARRDVIRKAIAEGDDFRVYTNRPIPRVMMGLFLMLFSYVICWPVILILGWLAIRTSSPLLVIVGGPVAYTVSSVVFFIGLYLAGKDYAGALMKWLVKHTFEKILGPQIADHDGSVQKTDS